MKLGDVIRITDKTSKHNGRRAEVIRNVGFGQVAVKLLTGPKEGKEVFVGAGTVLEESDPVNHPPHYTQHPSGVECIQITEHMSFNLGNALKYIWRCDLKADAIKDLEKAIWYIEREIAKRTAREGAGHDETVSFVAPYEGDFEEAYWDERMDIIARNGNNGEHYNES